MSQLTAFTKFLQDRKYAVADFESFSEIIEPTSGSDGERGYRLKRLKEADRITQKCKVLVQYTWHCRDYVKKILEESGIQEAGGVVNRYIKKAPDLQVVSYLANEYKHAGVDDSQRWATDIKPRFGRPFVRGTLEKFPFRLKPTVQIWGDSIPGFEFEGSAGVGDAVYRFDDFVWTFSCEIEDKDGRVLGHALAICERAFELWSRVLLDHGIRISK